MRLQIWKKLSTASNNSKFADSYKKIKQIYHIHIILLSIVNNRDNNVHILFLSQHQTSQLL